MDPKKLAGLQKAEAFVAHIDTVRHDGVYEIKEFVPIRKVEIRQAKWLGEFLWVSFVLGDWVYYREEAKPNVPNEHHETFKRASPPECQDQVAKTLYEVERFEIGTSPDESGESSDTIVNWFRIVSHVSKLDAHKSKRSVFLKLCGIVEGEEKFVQPTKLKPAFIGYLLDAGKYYVVQVLQFFPYTTMSVPFRYLIQTDSRVIRELKNEDIVQGKYDLLRMIVQCESANRDENSFLRFLPPDESQHIMASTTIQIRVRRSRIRLLVRFGLICMLTSVGVLLAGLSSQLVSGQQPNLFALELSTIGAVLTTAGVLLAESRL